MKHKNTNNDIGRRISTLPGHWEKLDNLTSAGIQGEKSSPRATALRALKPPMKTLRNPKRINQQLGCLPRKKQHSEWEVNKFIGSDRDRLHSLNYGRKNVELLDHMMEILRITDRHSTQQPVKLSTEAYSFNEFAQAELLGSRSYKQPVLVPKISRFYNNQIPRRNIYSEQKCRGFKLAQLRNSVSKKGVLDNLQLMTFYNKQGDK